MKAFLGIGHLGSNFVKAMLAKGQDVQVWNRSPEKAAAMETFGARAFPSVQEAVSGADVIHLTLKDDATVDAVLEQAEPALKPGAVLIDHTTTSVDGALSRTKDWAAKGFTYLHAPVFMGPQNALDSTGIMLVSGAEAVLNRLMPELSPMTGKVMNFGPEEGKAAGMKLLGNLFLVALTGGLADMLLLAKSLGIEAADISTLLQEWNPGAAVQARLQKITTGDRTKPTWELGMARKDVGLMIQEAEKGDARMTVIPAIAEEMDRWIAMGHDRDDWTVIAKDALDDQ